MRVGMLHSSHSIDSVGYVFGGVHRALEQRHQLLYRPPEYVFASKERQVEITKELLRGCDAVLGATDEIFLEAREQSGQRVPYIWFMLGNMPRGVPHLFKTWQYFRTSDVFAGSCTADIEIGKRFFDNAQLWLLPFAFDETAFFHAGDAAGQLVRARLGFGARDKILFYSGRLTLEKNLHTLLKIFSVVQKAVPEARLVVAGQWAEVPFMEFGVYPLSLVNTLIKVMDKLGVDQKRVHFVGQRGAAELRDLYNAADVAVNMTLHHDENFGLSQVEAMACGTPVVCTDWGGLKDTVVEGETGHKVRTVVSSQGVKLDWWEAACKLVTLLRDDALRQRLGRRAREHVLDNYTPSHYARGLESILAACEAGGGGGAPLKVSEFGQRFWKVCAPQAGALPPNRRSERAYQMYRELIGYYASPGDGGGPLQAGDSVCLTVPVTLDDGAVESDDIIFPFKVAAPERLREMLGALLDVLRREPVITVERLTGACPSDPGRVAEALAWLKEAGVLLKTRPLQREALSPDIAARMGTPLFSIHAVDLTVDAVTLR